jgi:hypothetical protein
MVTGFQGAVTVVALSSRLAGPVVVRSSVKKVLTLILIISIAYCDFL